MPFKLRLKKSRQYNVVSKSLFVLCVELLDGSNVECTLSAESSGQECLHTVCQRLGLHQPEFFGLRYAVRHGPPALRWVEADRPLKRQIDKHAREPSLMLRVMYYVTGVHLLTDEMTRYHYFLQLKMDVIEGRISCDANQAILLASYSMQAEFGNHDMERHTAEYLKDFVLFPKHLTEQGHLESLTEAVIHQHAALAGLAQGTAEEFYILAAQKLDGYGIEHFAAKDEQGLDVILGISLSGIIVNGTETGQPLTKFYPWKNIANVISHKKSFGIEGQPPDTSSVEFHLSETECAKYIWRLCVYQHTFYAQNEQALILETTTLGEGTEIPLPISIHQPIFQMDSQIMDSYDDLDAATNGIPSNISPLPNLSTNSTDQIIHLESTALTSNSISNMAPATAAAAVLQQQRAQSTSCLDLASTSTTSAQIDKLRALLPSYRSAPDYETAMQLKYRATSQAAAAAAVAAATGMYLYSSQPEIHQTHGRENVNSYTHYKPYPDVTRISQHLYEDTQPNADSAIHKYRRDLEGAGLDQQLLQSLQLVQVYKPPPPYPIGRPSSSTPDLASQPLGAPIPASFNPQVSGSSPDLVSSRSLGIQARRLHEHQQLVPNPEAHRTYANLAAVAESEISRYPPVTPGNMESSNATQSGLLYSYPMLTGHPPHSRSNRFPHQEPIYENVPLPWQTAEAVRSRASSIQSAPERTNLQTQPGTPQRRKSHTAAPTEFPSTSSTTTITTSTNINEMPVDVPGHIQSTLLAPTAIQSPSSINKNYEHQINMTVASSSSSTNSNTSGKNKIRKKIALLIGGGKNSKDKTRKDNQAVDELQHKWSTGLPRMPLAPNISKENMCQLLERKLVDSQLFFEFEKIPKKKLNADFSTALLPENVSRNRFKELLPYEENRVRLIPSKENRTGYINGSHITATVGNQARFYIAAQGPLPTTVNNFWQMIWEADVYLVVMLTGLHDDELGTSSNYFPVIGDRCLQVGEFQIWRQFSQETGHCVTSKLRVFHTIARRSRGVWHLRYGEWGDQGCPNSVGHFLGFLEELNSVRQQAAVEVPAGHNGNPPMLVHCTAGVGRTGVVILGDLLLYTLDHNQELDVPRVVTQLRQQRMLMVQTVAQYRFIYSLLIYYLKHSRLI